MAEHLNSEDLKAYTQRTASPAMMLSFDDHLAVCPECRAQLTGSSALVDWAQNVEGQADDGHLNYDQLVARSENRVPANEQFSLESHLKRCQSCRDDLADLMDFQRTLQGQPARAAKAAWVYGAAAAAAAVAITGLWIWHGQAGSSPVQIPTAWNTQDRSLVQQALAAGKLPFNPPPSDLSAKAGTLLGLSTPNAFSPVGPLGVVVEQDRPEFRWQELAGAVSYQVEVYSRDFQMVAQSPALTTTSWTPEQPLERGQFYQWQIIAKTKTGTVTVPSPPAPDAQFRVLDQATEDRIVRARAEGPMGHVLAASLLAEAGMRAEAIQELNQLPPEVRSAPEVQKLISAAQ